MTLNLAETSVAKSRLSVLYRANLFYNIGISGMHTSTHSQFLFDWPSLITEFSKLGWVVSLRRNTLRVTCCVPVIVFILQKICIPNVFQIAFDMYDWFTSLTASLENVTGFWWVILHRDNAGCVVCSHYFYLRYSAFLSLDIVSLLCQVLLSLFDWMICRICCNIYRAMLSCWVCPTAF